MKLVTIVAAGVVFAVAAAPAHAVPREDAQTFVQTALQHWARTAPHLTLNCPNGINVQFVDDSYFASRGWDPGNSAYGTVGGCEQWYRASMWDTYGNGDVDRWTLCVLVTHETGHNLGLAHDTYPVMTGYEHVFVPECGPAGTPIPAAAPLPPPPVAKKRTCRPTRRGCFRFGGKSWHRRPQA